MRKLTVTCTSKPAFIGGAGSWVFTLDGVALGMVKKTGDSITQMIDERSHTLQVMQYSALGTPTTAARIWE